MDAGRLNFLPRDVGNPTPFSPSSSEFISPSSFWLPHTLTGPYSWVEHIPFAFWLVGALRPACVVELGVHSGNSYFAFCQAIQNHRLDSRSYAVDTWLGDGESSPYGEAVFEEFSHHHAARYSTFSTVVRALFDEAHQQFTDGSIDLLHLDGLHTYEAAKHDVDLWLPKMSEGGVVLLHGINGRGREPGVHLLWSEISPRFPHFEFRHGCGLGVLGVGPAVPLPVRELLSIGGDPPVSRDVRVAYAQLGAHLGLMTTMRDRAHELERLRSEVVTNVRDLRQGADRARSLEATVQALRRIRSQVEQQVETAAVALQRAQERERSLEATVDALAQSAEVAQQQNQETIASLAAVNSSISSSLSDANDEIFSLWRRLSDIERSTSWRLTWPLRRILARMPLGRLVLRRGMKIIWWTITLQLPGRLKQWVAARRAQTGVTGASAASRVEAPMDQARAMDLSAERPNDPASAPPTLFEAPAVDLAGTRPAVSAEPSIDPAGVAVDLSESRAVLPGGRKMSVVVCVHNALEDVQRCLDSVLEHSREPHEIVLIDDGSERETRDFLQRFAQEWCVTLIRHDVARGYSTSANEGIEASSGDYVVLLNSDTVVTSGWLDAIELTFDSHPRTGIVGPLSNTASWQSVPTVIDGDDWASNPIPPGLGIADVGRLVAERRPGYHSLPFINGFCFAVRKRVFSEIGTFDTSSFPIGYGEENDFCIRARQRGWELRIADNCYTWHAQSKSFSHPRRRRLETEAGRVLAQLHDADGEINVPASFCRASLGMEGVREWVRRRFEREMLIREVRSRYAGARVAFILPAGGLAGGVNVVLQEAEAFRRFGIEVSLINVEDRRNEIFANYPEARDRWLFVDDVLGIPSAIRAHGPFDAVITTAYMSTFWAPKQDELPTSTRSAYYIQDFEPLFYGGNDLGGPYALASYRWDLKQLLFTKTMWNRDLIAAETGRVPHVIGPSVDVDLFQPIDRSRRWPPDDGIRICAMVRPGTERRAPEKTYRLLAGIARHFGRLVQCHTFGCAEHDLEPYRAEYPGRIFHHGQVPWRQMPKFLSAMDVFIDRSNWQAMGLTLMEAMASGLLVIGPTKGGAKEIVTHGQNGFLVDTLTDDAAFAIIEQIVRNEHDAMALRRNAIVTAHSFYPETAAAALTNVVLSDRESGRVERPCRRG